MRYQRLTVPLGGIAFDTVATLGSAQTRYALSFRWNTRSGDWRVTIRPEASKDPLYTSARVSPGAMLAKLPEGEIHVFGDDPYGYDALNKSLVLYFYPVEELRSGASALGEGFTLVTS
jgi:hypothetical protein